MNHSSYGAGYLGVNADVREVMGDTYYRGGMIHWVSSGRAEGRAGAPAM
jgi:hypothetical protein